MNFIGYAIIFSFRWIKRDRPRSASRKHGIYELGYFLIRLFPLFMQNARMLIPLSLFCAVRKTNSDKHQFMALEEDRL